MADCSALAGLLKHDHKLAAYCAGCDRWAVLPLAGLVSQGKGSLRLPITVRCRDCGEVDWPPVRTTLPTCGLAGWTLPLRSKKAPEGMFASNALVAGVGFLIREHVLDVTPKGRRRA